MIIEHVHDKHSFVTFLGQLRAELPFPLALVAGRTLLSRIFSKLYRLGLPILENPSDNPWQLAATLVAAGKSYE
jgi:hypothetical protein